jgi:uncharacterized protein
MKHPSKHPQEIEVWYILPAIRKELVLALKKKYSQKEIAHMLHLTPAAVSQYVNLKRGKEITLPKDVIEKIGVCSKKIVDKKTAFRQIQEISLYIKSTKALCRIHKDVEGDLNNCDICFR